MDYTNLSIEHDYTSEHSESNFAAENDENLDDIIQDSDENMISEEGNYSTDTKKYIDSNARKNTRIWTNNECSKRLIDFYNELNPKIGKKGQFTKKKDMHEYIAEKLFEEFGVRYTGEQVCSRIKNFYRRKEFKRPQLSNRTQPASHKIDISRYNLASMYDDDSSQSDGEFPRGVDEELSKVEIKHNGLSKISFTNEQTRKLLKLYNMFIANIGSTFKFKCRRNVWEAISEELYHEFNVKFTPDQCHSRYKTICKRAKRTILRRKFNLSKKQNVNKNDNRQNVVSVEDEESESASEGISVANKNQSYVHKKFQKFYNVDLMKQYFEFKEKKAKIQEARHNEIIEQLNKINKILLEIKRK